MERRWMRMKRPQVALMRVGRKMSPATPHKAAVILYFWDAVRSRMVVPMYTHWATILPVVPEGEQSYAPSTQDLYRSSSLFSSTRDLGFFFRISTHSRNPQETPRRTPHSFTFALPFSRKGSARPGRIADAGRKLEPITGK